MPVKRRVAKLRDRELTMEQFWSLSLGDCQEVPFESDAHRRVAWEQHRERFMAHCPAGMRPQGWWDYESPEPREDGMDVPECRQLYRMGELKGAELAEVEAHGREVVAKADAGGSYHAGISRGILTGEAAPQAWRDWAGVPDGWLSRTSRGRTPS